jgi:hypothetical protein
MEKDREFLTKLILSLKCSNKITKDECGDLNIVGKKGKIYRDNDFWYVFINDTSIWRKTKEQISFMEVWQNGDREGVLRLDRLPTEREAKIINKLVGLGKKREISEKERARLILIGSQTRLQKRLEPRPLI